MKLNKENFRKLIVENLIISKGLKYHVDNSIPLCENIYRPGSYSFFELVKEARDWYSKGYLTLMKEDIDIINSELGNFGHYNGRQVALDYPISQEADMMMSTLDNGYEYSHEILARIFTNEFGNEIEIEVRDADPGDFYDHEEPYEGVRVKVTGPESEVENIMTKMEARMLLSLLYDYFCEEDHCDLLESDNEEFTESKFSDDEGRIFSVPAVVEFAKQNHDKYFVKDFPIDLLSHDLSYWQGDEERMMKADIKYPLLVLIENDELSVADGLNRLYKSLNVLNMSHVDIYLVPKEDIIHFGEPGRIDEKRKRKKKKKKKKKSGSYYKGKKVKLNKPKRGGSKKFYVYVKNPKTGNIKKIEFGAKGMTTGLRDPARRKSFKARHNCEDKNDKTKAGYWACRIGRYPKVTGAPYTTWW